MLSVLIRFYQILLSPLFHFLSGPGSGCRFHPSCSEYSLRAVRTHGSVAGFGLSVRRVLRCHPFSKGGWDPVPPAHQSGIDDSRIGRL